MLENPDKLNLTDPVERDGVNIPTKSTMVLQWIATNPGKWFFHCHVGDLATGITR